MKITNLLRRIKPRFTSGTVLWSLCFLLIFLFISTTTSFMSSAATNPRDTAGFNYLGKKGFVYNLADAMAYEIMAVPQPLGSNSTAYSGEGAIYSLGILTESMYKTPSSSGIVWAFDQLNQIRGLESLTVQAQDPGNSTFYYPGIGYNVLRPVNVLWQWARNVTYFFFIIIFIIIAFLILFRQNLGGQAVVTIANSIPSVMIALVLVTLSYAIVGFFVDVITIGTNVAQGIIITSPGAPGNELITSKFLGEPREDLFYLQPNDPETSIWGIWYVSNSNICNDNQCQVLNILPDLPETAGKFYYIGAVVQSIITLSTSTLGSSSNSLLNLLIGITAFTTTFKLFMTLLKNYVIIIVYAIISPFVFITAAIPGKTYSTITNFVRTLGASSLSFVGVYAIFLIMIVIGQSENFSGAFSSIKDLSWAPPLLGYDQSQIVGSSSIIRTLIIYFLFVFSASVPEIIHEWLQAPAPSQYISRVGQETMTGAKRGFAAASWGLGKLS